MGLSRGECPAPSHLGSRALAVRIHHIEHARPASPLYQPRVGRRLHGPPLVGAPLAHAVRDVYHPTHEQPGSTVLSRLPGAVCPGAPDAASRATVVAGGG